MHIPPALYSSMRFNFLYVDRYVFRRGWFFPETYIPYCMVRYILKGNAVFTINGKEMEVCEGQVSYIPEGCYLECCALGEEFQFISIRFATTVRLENNDFLSEFFHIPLLTEQVSDEVLGYFEEVYHNATSNNAARLFRIRGNLELILASLVDQTSGAITQQENSPEADFSIESIRHREARSENINYDSRIQVVVEYLISHPTEPFDSAFLSEMANMSQSSLRRLFKKHTGRSPKDYIKDLRMTVAARRLLITDDRIANIAYELGFDDQNYFARMFKSTFGVSPTQYRKASRE